ncbi:hypothetical protein PINS_up023408 [Pythium insidiosum]|nr:hypothetical protein PINS_up023408 [Pythium insidiosum]
MLAVRRPLRRLLREAAVGNAADPTRCMRQVTMAPATQLLALLQLQQQQQQQRRVMLVRCLSTATAAPVAAASSQSNAKDSASQPEIKWPSDAAKLVNRRLKFFPRDYEVRELAIEAGLNPEQWGVASSSFRQSFMKQPELYFQDQQELQHFVADVNHGQKKKNTFVFYPHFLEFAREKDYIPRTGEGSFTLQQITDLRLPHQLYPLANAMQRRIIYHQGPTNSGKTYQALERLKNAGEDGGLYCGPLRLLALEIYERLNMDGVYTSLVTGQEKKIMPHATHVSCTVEMANINRKWDVAVIDEIQLIGDPQRGWAWTRALFGCKRTRFMFAALVRPSI